MTKIQVSIESLPLVAGNYTMNLWLGTGSTPIHWLEDCMLFRVEEGPLIQGRVVEARGYPVVVPSSWAMVDPS